MSGMTFKRVFTEEGVHPYDLISWKKRDVKITDSSGEIIFEQEGVEVPSTWSQLATDIVASKYMRRDGVPELGRESSVEQLIDRVVQSISQSALDQGGYFESDREIFEDELTYILVNQIAAFNSPVWFNCGLFEKYGCLLYTSPSPRD